MQGDSYVARNLKADEVEAASFNTSGALTSNTVYASGGVRGHGVMVGKAPDYEVGCTKPSQPNPRAITAFEFCRGYRFSKQKYGSHDY